MIETTLFTALIMTIKFILVIIFHEIGHYLFFRLYNIHPSFAINSNGPILGNTKELFKLKPLQIYYIAGGGIVVGLIFLLVFFQDNLALLCVFVVAYFVGCLGDIQLIFKCNGLGLWSHESIGELMIKDYKKELKELITIKNEINVDGRKYYITRLEVEKNRREGEVVYFSDGKGYYLRRTEKGDD